MNSEIIKERIAKVRKIMEREGVDVYVVVTGDYHQSEYAGEYFSERKFITGFTGSAGTFVLGRDSAALFTDGRYFVQAEKQIENTGICLMRMGVEGVKNLYEYCEDILPQNGVLGFDGRTVGAWQGIKMSELADIKNASCRNDFDAIDEIFTDRPAFPDSRAFYLDEKYSGRSIEEKLELVRKEMIKNNADVHIIASLDDICWLFNIRGNDVECNPVVMSYAMILENRAYLYANSNNFDGEILAKLSDAGVSIKEYEQIYEDIKELNDNRVLIDLKRINMRLYNDINKTCTIIKAENPEVLLKAMKNETEIRNLKDAHIDDGVAVTKFMYWLKKSVKTTLESGTDAEEIKVAGTNSYAESREIKDYITGETITEYSAAEYLDNCRAKIKDYIELSFNTISAYNANAAMMHYQASKDNCASLKTQGMLLVDSGGQYLRGTTDITRTFALGHADEKMKKYFTLTLKGMLNLANARFLKGCTGFNLDILARQPLWNVGMDYRCGTGHGVGYLLNVHESPNGFRWKHNPGVNDLCVLDEGMVTSDEPGVYIEDEFGIRIENEIVCVKDYENEYGTFLKFDMLTKVPIDLELVDIKYLDDEDIRRLNAYHKDVYESLKDYFEGEELEFLKKATAQITR